MPIFLLTQTLPMAAGDAVKLSETAAIGTLLILISVCDIRKRRIPDELILIGVLLRLRSAFIPSLSGAAEVCLNAFLFTVPLLLVVLSAEWLLQRQLLGGGDLKLIFLLSMDLSYEKNLYALLLALLLAGIACIFVKKYRQGLPFAPFLSAGWSLVYMLYG